MFAANVVRVMIASPSDVSEARDAVEKAPHGWNSANAQSRSLVLLPWRWETGAVAVMGDHPQALINQQGVDDSDVVIALFGGRLGSPTRTQSLARPRRSTGPWPRASRCICSSRLHLSHVTSTRSSWLG